MQENLFIDNQKQDKKVKGRNSNTWIYTEKRPSWDGLHGIIAVQTSVNQR